MLEVNNLHVTFSTYGGTVKAVRGVNFHLHKGETLAIVVESGCGKSVTANAIMRLIPDPPGKITQDRKSTRLNSSHVAISYAVFCLKNKNKSDMNAETVRRLSTVECSRAARTLCVHSIMIEENTTTCLSRDHW